MFFSSVLLCLASVKPLAGRTLLTMFTFAPRTQVFRMSVLRGTTLGIPPSYAVLFFALAAVVIGDLSDRQMSQAPWANTPTGGRTTVVRRIFVGDRMDSKAFHDAFSAVVATGNVTVLTDIALHPRSAEVIDEHVAGCGGALDFSSQPDHPGSNLHKATCLVGNVSCNGVSMQVTGDSTIVHSLQGHIDRFGDVIGDIVRVFEGDSLAEININAYVAPMSSLVNIPASVNTHTHHL
jgi:hypothetical protein